MVNFIGLFCRGNFSYSGRYDNGKGTAVLAISEKIRNKDAFSGISVC